MGLLVSKSLTKNVIRQVARKRAATPLLSLVLRGGVILSAAIVGFGLVLLLVTGQTGYTLDTGKGGSQLSNLLAYHDENSANLYFPINPVEIWQGLISLKPFGIIMFGLTVLIITPVLNILLITLSYLRQRNLIYTLISLFVLTVLTLGFFLGKAGG